MVQHDQNFKLILPGTLRVKDLAQVVNAITSLYNDRSPKVDGEVMFVCLSVDRLLQEVVDGFGRNLVERLGV